ncbi:MAG: hypothetical protein WD055_06360 [Candidatus Dependentiae bacterium]
MTKYHRLIYIISILSIHKINTKESQLTSDESLRHDVEQLKEQIETAKNQIKGINTKLLAMEQKNFILLHMQQVYRKETLQMISDLHKILKNNIINYFTQ